jgi:hypothetical protein
MSASEKVAILDMLIQNALKTQAQAAAAGQEDKLASPGHMVEYLEHKLGRIWGLQVKKFPNTRLLETYEKIPVSILQLGLPSKHLSGESH